MRMRVRLLLALLCVAGARAEQRLHFCGRELAETLRLLCRNRGGFNDPPPAHLRRGAARHVGVANECCRLGCSLSTLLSYCKFDDVVQSPRTLDADHTRSDSDACVDDDHDDDKLFDLQLLHRPGGWCGAWQPASPAPPGGEVECTCSRGGGSGEQLENVVRKGPWQPHRQRSRQPPRQLSRQPQTTRRPVIRGTVTPYFAGRPVLSPPHTQRQPATI